jgi:cob(I)alamin adenosyltransferase
MALFTGKGDNGTTKVFDTEKGVRISKSSAIAEALGSLDEVNSFLGIAKVKSQQAGFYVGKEQPSFGVIVHDLQEGLFTVQAELAGAPKTIAQEKVKAMEEIIGEIEKELPPITTFFISGGTELAAVFDVARTLARRAERRIVAVKEEGVRVMGEHSLAFMNRLSSVLYALARLSNHKAGVSEEPPTYR